jgi:hypothetical protein
LGHREKGILALTLPDRGRFCWRVLLDANSFFLGNESRHVMPGVDDNVEGMLRSFALVILVELLSKPVELHPYDSVPVLVEIRRSSQDFGGETVFLDLVRLPLKIFIANVLEQLGLLGSFGKDT